MTMKKIKFRAWSKYKDKFYYADGSLEFRDENGIRIYFTNKHDSNKYVMQFTGLHDQNGKEIYEGDVLEISAGAPWDEDVIIHPKGEVVYGHPFPACFNFVSKDDNTCCLYDLCGMEFNGRIIGNIHENEPNA